MERIWAPWRVQYIQGEKKEGCIFCEKAKEDRDRENYVLFRGVRNFAMLNAYPYNPGHLMVAPYRHIAGLDEMTDEEMLEHFKLVRRAASALSEAFGPAGFNVGINLGRTAGAGVEGHIHTHIVPRWNGDTNFTTVIFDVRVLPQALEATYEQLKNVAAWSEIA